MVRVKKLFAVIAKEQLDFGTLGRFRPADMADVYKRQVLYGPTEKFPIGGSKTLRKSSSDACVVVAAGITLHEALKAHDLLKADGIAIRVIDAYSVKPIDAAGLREAAASSGQRVIVVEDHWLEGGLGDAVLEVFAESGNVRIRKVGVTELPHSGKPEELLDVYGLSARRIAETVRAFVK